MTATSGVPLDVWFRTELRDSSFNDFTAFRTLGVDCTQGLDGQGITLPETESLVYVPDQPAFTFERGVTVAAWVNPTTVKGIRTIFRKRDGLTSAMALMLVTSFAASIGGMGTPVGTPPNLIGKGLLQQAGIQISFAGWMALCVPMMILMMAFVFTLVV